MKKKTFAMAREKNFFIDGLPLSRGRGLINQAPT
jgi:hypothetical protein